MKLQEMEVPFMKNYSLLKIPIILLISFAFLLLTIFPTHDSSLETFQSTPLPKNSSLQITNNMEKCDIFNGEWIPNPEGPYYTNTTCWSIHEHQNCIKYGRPDSGFLKWRWKPDGGCDLPVFDPLEFLDIVRGKSMAFVGDSVARNQVQSLICLLTRVEYPTDVSYTQDFHFKRWNYSTYNFTLAVFSSPFLVKVEDPEGLYSIYLDEPDEKWTTQMEEFDYVIISAGHWFNRPGIYYENHRIVGCRYCQITNITDLQATYGYRKAFRTAFRALNNLRNYKGITYVRTFAPAHFENGEFNNGGNCLRKMPYKRNEISLDGNNLDFHKVQLEEFLAAERVGKKKGLKFRLLDITKSILLRPDGHPSTYGHWPNETVTLYNDCVHWCLPGPIDSWNDFFLHMLKMESGR